MERATVVTLISKAKPKGVYDTNKTDEREVFALVLSVGMTERYTAMAHGFDPEKRFKLALAEEWQDEPQLRHKGKLYNILRTYETDDGGIELICERSNDDVV